MINRSREIDLDFFQSITFDQETPEYSGFNTKLCRETKVQKGYKTNAMYTPLIDLKPSEPTTMLTAMYEAQRLTELTGQKYTVLTCDQQLYKILVDIKWAFPDTFQSFVLRYAFVNELYWLHWYSYGKLRT